MPVEKSTQPKRQRYPFSSIGAKITLILMAMGAMSAFGGIMVTMVFQGVEREMENLTQDKLPQLEISSDLIQAANGTKDAMTSALLAENAEALAVSKGMVDQSTARLSELASQLPERSRGEFRANAAHVSETLAELVAARNSAFKNAAWIKEQTNQLQELSGRLQETLIEKADTAYFNLVIGGEDTISRIDGTLTTLVEQQFASLQLLLEARSEINLLSGLTMAIGTTSDPSMLSILTDLAKASEGHLTEIVGALETSDQIVIDVAPIKRAAVVFSDALSLGRIQSDGTRQGVLKARLGADMVLASAVDDMVFTLTIAADEASTDNGQAIQNLMDNEVGFLNTLLEINSWISNFQVAALEVVVATGIDETKTAAVPLSKSAEALGAYLGFDDGALSQTLTDMIALADPESGLPSFKIASLQANSAASEASRKTAEAVLAIAENAGSLGADNRAEIGSMARSIAAKVFDSAQQMQILLMATGGVFLIALLLTKVFILNPLRAVSATTERLAKGDLRPVTGFNGASDEIFRIATSLAIFRDGLVEKEEISKTVEAERSARMAEQEKAVSALGQGLAKLSQGDLTANINAEMSEGYAMLRDDFNATLETLTATMAELVQATSSITDGSNGISQAAEDLSQRTENQAATLEETAAALDELTSSVRTAADGARNVETTVQEAKEEAETSEGVVKNAVEAMTEIEGSSSEISKIVNVIDDIAFQTNLLALNAGVEAARAGDAGKGFAVVASEVRALAQRSSDSAMEIKSLIEKSSFQVERGVDLVGKAGTALHAILDRIGQISKLVTEIAQVAVEQSTGLDQINTGMAQLDRVTQQNAAMVQETTAASRVLQGNAAKLSGIVGHFKTDGSVAPAPLVSTVAEVTEPAPEVAVKADGWDVAPPEVRPLKVAGGGDALWNDF